jgi:DNA repair ATPase RecN
MKKMLFLALVLVLAFSMTGCASILKMMGGVNKNDYATKVGEIDKKLAAISTELTNTGTVLQEMNDIKSLIEKLQADVAAVLEAAEQAKQAKATVDALMPRFDSLYAQVQQLATTVNAMTARVDNMPNETLLKLARLLQETVKQVENLPAITPVPVQPPVQPVTPPAESAPVAAPEAATTK